jgi:hypothetical protein
MKRSDRGKREFGVNINVRRVEQTEESASTEDFE